MSHDTEEGPGGSLRRRAWRESEKKSLEGRDAIDTKEPREPSHG